MTIADATRAGVVGPLADELADRQRRIDPDFAGCAAGAEARERARRLRARAPVRTAVARVLGLKTDERTWRERADGQEAVGAELAKLGPSWRVIHAVPIGGPDGDVDHLVIGPTGVFAISTQNHPDANVWVNGDIFKVNGVRRPFVRNSRFAAAQCAKVLTAHTGLRVDVHPAIAVMGAGHGFIVKTQPAGVRVVRRRALTREIDELAPTLDSARMDALYVAASCLSTWQSPPESWLTTSRDASTRSAGPAGSPDPAPRAMA